jgi:hypothetical protein
VYPPSKKRASAKHRNGPNQMLLQGFQTWQHHLECSCWIFFLGAANQERQGAGHEKLGKSETTNIMTYYDILRPYHIINKSDKSGGSSKQMQQKRPCLREANQTLSGQTDLEPDVRRFRLIHNGARSGKKIYHQK